MLVDNRRMSNTLRVLTLLLLALPAQLTESGDSPSGWGSSSGFCSIRAKFECRSESKCVPLTWMCDGEADCDDGSDEENCTKSCTEEQILCVSLGLCIPITNRCDGDNDCGDNSDEKDCPLTCGDSKFKCKNEEACVLRDVRCDGNDDCGDGSDEDPLLCNNITCTMEQFKCLNTNRCIDYKLRCNNRDDCGDYSDEEECPTTTAPPPTCGFGMFNCTSGGCVSSHYVCDGTRDCDDGSDELYCGPTCLPREFRCEASNLCILESWKCDGEVDCMEGEDEVGCPKENCTHSQFDCGDRCIPFSQRCDGRKHCVSGADEFNCSEIRCTKDEYQCRYIPECISGEKICDRVPDCFDGTDESDCSRSVTTCDGDHGCEQLCIETKNSFYCACNPGYQLNRFDGRSCIDIDECAMPGVCTQLCHNSPGNYSCECVDGYTLLGGSYCKAGGDAAYLLYASLHSISRVTFSETSVFSGPSTIVIHNQPLISGIDYDLRANKLYWGDLRVDTIMRSNLDGSNKETFTIPGSVHAPEGVAVDWVTGNIYWVDGEKKTIEVSDKSGRHRKILVGENLDKPRGLVLDPTRRLMYWSDWGESPKIERASMDGSNRIVLHNTGIHWPNAIALDIPTQTLYWADPWYHSLQSSHVDGTNRQPVIPHGVNHAYDMTLFQDTAYWSDWASKSIYSGHKYSSANPRHVQSTSSYPMGLKVVHMTLQPMVENPCSRNNSGCSQLCLLSSADTSSNSSCACALGYTLQPDGRSCKAVDTFLIVARMTSILAIPLYQKTLPFFEIHLPLGTMKGVSDVAWDSQQNLVFWTDKILHTISVSHISGKNPKQLFTDDVLVPEGITYDWLTKKIYWVDRGYQRIEVADVTGENRAVLVSTGLNRPRGIAVHPYQGYLYWTDWGRHPKIERMNLDGTNRITVVDLFINNETHMPNHMDIDFKTDRIYWVEYNYARIMYANLDGTQVTKVGVDLSRAHPIGLAVHGDYVYWSNTERIKRTRKTLQKYFRYDIITPDLPLSLGMEVFHRNRTIVRTPCDKNNGGCSHLCLTRPAPNSEGFSEALSASCVCPTGLKLLEDGKTCANDVTKFLLVADKSALKMISLDVDSPVHTHIPITGTHNFNSADYDPIDDTIYWVDLPAAKILKVPRKGGNPKVVLDNLDHPNSIAIDWIGRTMYFADSGSKSIEVAHLNGTHRKKLIWDSVGTPRSLTINIKERLLYWTEWGENTSYIKRAFLDGTGRVTVVNNLNMWPQGLTVDTKSVTEKMYWIDSMTQAAYKLESPSKTPVVVIRSLNTPAGLAVMDNNLYYTEVYPVEPDGVVREFRADGPDRILSNRLESPYEVKAYDRSMKEKTDLYRFHPCSSSHSTGCSHLCLPSGPYGRHGTGSLRYSCACPSGIRLENDKKTCKQAPLKFLIYGTVGAVHRISMDTGDMADVVISSDAGYALSADFTSPREPLTSKMNGLQFEMDGYIFWSENSGLIKRMWFNGSCPESNCTFFTNAGSPRGLAVDWVTGNVYFVDVLSKTLRVVSYDGKFTKTIVSGHLDKPRAVAVDPKNGYLFYSDWGDNSRVERSDMSGSHRRQLTTGQETWPNEIAIDYSRQNVYWSDAWDRTIKVMEIDGDNQRNILENLKHPFGVAYHDDRLYWSQWTDNAVYSVSLRSSSSGGARAVKLTTNNQRVYGVNLVHGNRLEFPSTHPCVVKNGGCPFFCLMLNPTSWKCGCPDDMGDQCVETFHTIGTVTDTPPTDTPTADTPTTDTPTTDTPTMDTPPTNTSTINTPITDATDDSETPTKPTDIDSENTPRPTDDDSSGTPTGDTTGSVTIRTDPQTPHSPNTGNLDTDASNGTIFGINPGIFSAYVVISFLGIAISAMILVVCIVTLNVCRRKKALNETLKKGQLNKVAYYNTTPVKDLSTRSKKDTCYQPGVPSPANPSNIAAPSSEKRTHDSHMISMDTLSQGSSDMVLDYPTIVELRPGETSSPLDLLRTESRDSGMA